MDRLSKIESYGRGYDELVAALKRFPREMWTFRPSPDRWTVHEILMHITDSEANSYVRCRRLIAEPGQSVMSYDEMRWADALRYHDQDTDEAIELFKWLRLISYRLIKSLPEDVWSHTIVHPQNGTMTMDDWLDVYERHVREHVEQMQGNYEDWVSVQS